MKLRRKPNVHAIWLALLVCLTVPTLAAAGPRWNADARAIDLVGPDGKAWLTGAAAKIVLSDEQTIATDDKRFNVRVDQLIGRTVVSGTDAKRVVDWELVIRPIDGRAGRIELTIRNVSNKPLTLNQLVVLDGLLAGKLDADCDRVLTSGNNSWSGGKVVRLGEKSKANSFYTIGLQSPALAAGFLAGRHNLDRLNLAVEDGRVRLTAYGECDCVLPAGASRSTDPLFVCGSDALAGLEQFADLAAKENRVRLWPDNFATWCSWYAGWIRQKPLYEYKQGLTKGVEINIPLVAKELAGRGAASMRIVDDSYDMPYGDWLDRTKAIPNGFERLARQMAARGIRAGVWYPPFWVSERSRMFREHPEWLLRDKDGKVFVETRGVAKVYGNPFAYLDPTNPAAVDQIEATARAWRDRGFRYVMTDFMMWGARKQPRHDPTLTPVEGYNRALVAMRRGFGKDTYWLHCGAPLGPAMGYCDGMRISGDSHGAGTYSYISAGARWFYNWRVWLNDPDAIVCARYDDIKPVEWNRTWMSWMALAGCVLTYGDTLDDLPADQLAVYKRVLPPLSHAGRPLDIFENSPFLLWGADGGSPDGPANLLGVFELQGKGAGRSLTINLDEAVARTRSWTDRPARCPARRLLWDFWAGKLVVADAPTLTIDMPDKSCRIFAVHPDLGRPQLVGTNGHYSMGLLEVTDTQWDTASGKLAGKVRGNGGDPTTLYFHIPAGMKCQAVSVAGKAVPVRLTDQGVLAVGTPAAPGKPATFELRFTGKPHKPKTRAFVAGPAATATPLPANKDATAAKGK